MSCSGALTVSCGNTYGSNSDESNISFQMRYGSILDAKNAINQGKNTRGKDLGCPEHAHNYVPPNITEPKLNDILNIWNNEHVPEILSYNIECPRIGRYENNAALGSYYAMQAGYFDDLDKLSVIADMMYDQQYANWNISHPQPRFKGVYGYVNKSTDNTCYIGGVVGHSVLKLCDMLPQYCVDYTSGQFSGNSFAISSQDDTNKIFDGGIAYDHGWIGVQMIESSMMQNDSSLKQKYRNSVKLAGDFAIAEHSVKNHNYTAKLIWLLAQLYALNGDDAYKNELNYKLDKNLIPGILWDENNDGFVDGTMPPIAFESLVVNAQIPGRMWDGHNSISWYQAMNTWAMTEAYVAFRDKGENIRANQLKPYVIAMLDSLADEIMMQGTIATNNTGIRDITYALLIAIWKLSDYENESHDNWKHAAWAMWNTGYFNDYNTHSVNLGLYLLVKTKTPYVPLAQRNDELIYFSGFELR